MKLKNTDALLPDCYYHIYNRAVGSELFFQCDIEYDLFLDKWSKKICPIADTFAYCLIPNHFHFMIRMQSEEKICKALKISQFEHKYVAKVFAALFSSYALIYNKRHHRMGKLFMLPYRRRRIESDDYFTQLIYYIHGNPQHHGLEEDPTNWKYSSYHQILGRRPTWLDREAVLEWYNGRENFLKYHGYMMQLPNCQL